MRTFRDAKAMAKALREGLAKHKIELSHSDCLELVAGQFGMKDWNTLSARIERPTDGTPLALPEGWIVSGSRSEDYDMGIDEDEPGTALIRCKYAPGDPALSGKPEGFGTLMQTFAAEGYRGKRLVLRAMLKTVAVDGAATLWMRIDGSSGQTLRFDNMEKRTKDGVIRGTSDWSVRHIALDVPDDAIAVSFGFYLRGTGHASARDFEIAEAENDIATTESLRPERASPVNLGFAARARSAA